MLFAPKNARSSSRKPAISGRATRLFHRHISTTTNATRIVSIIIVPVTAIPYAAARLLDDWNPRTSAITATNSVRLVNGT